MVLTDVVMPGLSGPQMVEHILAVQPGMPVTFMTGTAADARLPRPQSSDLQADSQTFHAAKATR